MIIGPKYLVHLIMQEARPHSEMNMIPAPYINEQETLRLVHEYINEADIFLFTGPIPYEITKQFYKPCSKKMVYVPFTGGGLYRTLFKLIENQGNITSRSRISIDTLSQSDVEECFEELEIKAAKMYFQSYENEKGAEALYWFHYNLWMNKKIDAALTCVHSVYQRLKANNIPVYQIIPTKSSIRSSLQQVALESKNLQSADTQIAIMIMKLENLSIANKGERSNYNVQREKTILENILIDFSEEMQALFNWSGKDEIRFITTRGTIEKKTNRYRNMPILNEMITKTGIKSYLGIGFGRTANEAEIKARNALNRSRLDKRSGFVVDLDGTIQTIGQDIRLNYSIRSSDPNRIQLAKQTGLSVATINKLFSFNDGHEEKKVTAVELANGLGMTVRSARRILSALENNRLATIVGEEQPINRGRPRKIYAIHLIEPTS
ncbi:transcriptional regulator [Sporolactobacillus sp. THM7-7]|nr:transcriptional regulator [Sporolactobacillus sp. THM7-7]